MNLYGKFFNEASGISEVSGPDPCKNPPNKTRYSWNYLFDDHLVISQLPHIYCIVHLFILINIFYVPCFYKIGCILISLQFIQFGVMYFNLLTESISCFVQLICRFLYLIILTASCVSNGESFSNSFIREGRASRFLLVSELNCSSKFRFCDMEFALEVLAILKLGEKRQKKQNAR